MSKYDKIREYERKDGEYLYEVTPGIDNINYFNKNGNTNYREIVDFINDWLLVDDNFDWYINEVKKDALSIYEKNLTLARSNPNYEGKRDKENKYLNSNIENRMKDEDIRKSSRKLESEIASYYKDNTHNVFGNVVANQVNTARELRNMNLNLVFKNGNVLYGCQLEEFNSNKSFLNVLTKILTKYFVIQYNIKEDGEEKYFFKAMCSDFDINKDYVFEPGMIVPKYITSNLGLEIDNIKERLVQYGINLEIGIIMDDRGLIKEN